MRGRSHDALPPVLARARPALGPGVQSIDSKMGYYSMDAGVPITAGTRAAV